MHKPNVLSSGNLKSYMVALEYFSIKEYSSAHLNYAFGHQLMNVLSRGMPPAPLTGALIFLYFQRLISLLHVLELRTHLAVQKAGHQQGEGDDQQMS